MKSLFLYYFIIMSFMAMIRMMTQEVGSVIDLGNMLETTGSCGILSYTRLARGYGNHCGYGGSGKIIDNIDECCYKHDACWNAMNYRMQVTKTYTWGYPGGGPAMVKCFDCGPGKTKDEKIKCDICKCDRRLAVCVERAIKWGTPCPSFFG
jgi:secretory phospholipase A2